MKKIKINSPTRVDIAGGTLDLWPLYCFLGDAVTVNTAIDISTTAEIEEREDKKIIIESSDLNLKQEYDSLKKLLEDPSDKISLLRSQLKYWNPKVGFHLKTSSQSPIGGGLGGSSSLTISLLKAFSKLVNTSFTDVHQIVKVAHNIEAEILNTPTGTQDYYPAVSGGINILTYSHRGIHQELLSNNDSEFSDYFLLAYTGKAHHSGLNNFEVMKDAVAKDKNTLQALKDLREIAFEAADICRQQKWSGLGKIFKAEFEARVRLAPEFSSHEIVKLNEVSLQNGAEAVKICGAGGGGRVLIWCPPNSQPKVIDACQSAGFQILKAKPKALLSEVL